MDLTEAERLIQWQAKEIERLKQFEPPFPSVMVRYDLSPTQDHDHAIYKKLLELGWTPPASGGRICNNCKNTGMVHGLHNWSTGGVRSQKCWQCSPAPEPTERKFTVFCRERSDTGSTWVDTVTVEDPTLTGTDLLKHIQKIAVEWCAIEWGWEDSVDSIACYCVIQGEPDVLDFKDLS